MGAGFTVGEKWLFLDTGINSPAFNMAFDEVLLNWHSRGEIPPVVRFYEWNPAGLSLGHFQKTAGRIDVNAAKERGIGIVRRPTGGLAVLHDKELTYSIIIDEKHELMSPSIIESYRVLSQGLLEGYRLLGISAELAIPDKPIGKTGTSVCFEEASWYELEIGGKKAAGSAQTRQKGVILQHGSIPMVIDEDDLYNLFIFPSEKVKLRAKNAFKEKAISINRILGRETTIEEVKDAFKDGFRKGLNIEFNTYEPPQQMIDEARVLMEEKYAAESYTFYR
ncbi:lipoate--protein ligase family protein [Bacillus sp. FJAT-49736]|uniref:lipoate--protein ligase family protein n=1 Tax=Bacillus sp. FJAT-49736 TaxID=2833582 RepID=UPI001BCA2423|nr:lipoate--protein ligase family protein [Bacillus sp. FJAT-49736]MBS4174915.1 lipoate--protein ligase family protein [Bacillus sp. FJAT-49736]